MQDVLSKLIKETNYLDPYLKQFLKYLNKNKVLLIGKETDILNDKIKNMGFVVENIDFLNNKTSKKYDGVILFNNLNEVERRDVFQFFKGVYDILEDESFMLIVIRSIKNKNIYPKEYLDIVTGENFEFIEELNNYENLKFYIYEKKHY